MIIRMCLSMTKTAHLVTQVLSAILLIQKFSYKKVGQDLKIVVYSLQGVCYQGVVPQERANSGRVKMKTREQKIKAGHDAIRKMEERVKKFPRAAWYYQENIKAIRRHIDALEGK